MLATTAEFAAMQGVSDDPTNAEWLLILEGATAMIQSYTGQHLERVASDTVTLDGTGTRLLVLPELPVNAVAAVVIITGDVETTLDDSTYYVGAGGILYRRDGVWPCLPGTVRVTYDHGYAAIPADLVSMAIRTAAELRTTAPVSAGAVTSESIGNYSIGYASSSGTQNLRLSDDDRRLLDPYRKRRVA